MLPLSIPGLVTVGVLAFVASWNAYLLPLLLLRDDMRTLPLGVADYSTEHSADTAGVLAFTTLAMIPGPDPLPRDAAPDRQRAPGRGQGLSDERDSRGSW